MQNFLARVLTEAGEDGLYVWILYRRHPRNPE